MKEELRLIKQAIGTLQRAVAIMEGRLDVDTEKKQNGFKPPDHNAALAWHTIQQYTFDLDEWFNHYESNGWMVGKNKMRDWVACMAQWQTRHKKKNPDPANRVRFDAHGNPRKENGQGDLL